MRWVAGKVVEGFAWMVGASAGREFYDEVSKEEPAPPKVDPKVAAREAEQRAKAEAKELARLVKERAEAKRRFEKDVDAELRALKKRVAREAK